MQLMHLLSEKNSKNEKVKIHWQNRQLDSKRSFETTGNSAEVKNEVKPTTDSKLNHVSTNPWLSRDKVPFRGTF